jgi:6-phosphogluconolactonase
MLLVLLGWLWMPPAASDLRTGDYWMITGTFTWRSGQGIYLARFHSSGDGVQAAGLAAGPIWQANRGSWGGSLPRLIAQIRQGWPSPRAMGKGVQNPAFLAVHPNRPYVYSADQNPRGEVTAFRVNRANGKLTPLNSKPSGGSRPCFVTVDPNGRNLLVANYDSSVAVLPIEADGTLGDATSVITYAAKGSHAHSINISPDNRFAVVTDLGLDQVHVYRFDGATGVLSPHTELTPQLPPGSGPRHFAFHPNGALAYLITESSNLVVMRWDAQSGVLTPVETVSTLPAGYKGESGAAEIEVHPNGRFLYASNRGHDSVAVFSIDQSSGRLAKIQDISTQGGPPSSIRISPDGNALFAGNVLTNNIVEFRMDSQTGLLSPAGSSIRAVAPICIRFVPAH